MQSNSIKTGKKDALVSYLRYFVISFSNIFILPVILSKVSSAEYGLWSTFLSISAFIALVDSGFASVVTRYVTYAYCGARSIKKDGLPDMCEKSEPNHRLIFEIIYTAKGTYRKIALIAASLFLFATVYILYLCGDTIGVMEALIAWVLFAFGNIIKLYFTYYTAFIKGLGKIKETESIHLITAIIYLFTRMLFVSMGFGIIGLGIASLLDAILFRALIAIYLNRYISAEKEIANQVKSKLKNEKTNETKEALWKNSKQMGLITITDYITGQGKTLLCSTLMPLSTLGSFSLTNQLLNVAVNLSLVPYNTFRVKLGDCIVSNDSEGKKNLFSFMVLSEIGVITLGTLVMLLFGDVLLRLVHSNTQLLDTASIILLLVYQLIISTNKVCTYYISLKNTQPFMKSYIISSFAGVIGAFILGLFWENGFLCYILSALVSQLVYNAWKWPRYAIKDIGLNPLEIPKRGIECGIKILKGKN